MTSADMWNSRLDPIISESHVLQAPHIADDRVLQSWVQSVSLQGVVSKYGQVLLCAHHGCLNFQLSSHHEHKLHTELLASVLLLQYYVLSKNPNQYNVPSLFCGYFSTKLYCIHYCFKVIRAKWSPIPIWTSFL